jgi:hypothetical protein
LVKKETMKTKALQTMAVMGIASVALAGAAVATPFTIYSTGESATYPSTVALYSAGAADAQYTLVQNGGATIVTSVLTAAAAQTPVTGTQTNVRTPVVGGWAPNTSTSEWIAPQAYTSTNAPDGIYAYQTTFSLTSIEALTAVITGKWATDNTFDGIYLNGTLIAGSSNSSNSDFGTLTSFPTISSGFLSGTNTLDFYTINTTPNPSPTGVQIQLSGTYTSPTPEPSTTAVYAKIQEMQ